MTELPRDKIRRWIKETFRRGQIIIPRSFDTELMPASSVEDYLSLIGKEGVIINIGPTILVADFGPDYDSITIMPTSDTFEIVRDVDESIKS